MEGATHVGLCVMDYDGDGIGNMLDPFPNSIFLGDTSSLLLVVFGADSLLIVLFIRNREDDIETIMGGL
jgi:hypothetical protein